MADREISDYLSSGDATGALIVKARDVLQVGGVDVATETVTDALDARLDLLEADETVDVYGVSLASTQEPGTTDTVIDIEFGAAQSTTNVNLSVAGVLTFNTAGQYHIALDCYFGRSGGTGTSLLFGRFVKNSTQLGSTFHTKIDNADVLLPFSYTFKEYFEAGATLKLEMFRDSSGDNSGGLFAASPTTITGWADSPSAAIKVIKHI